MRPAPESSPRAAPRDATRLGSAPPCLAPLRTSRQPLAATPVTWVKYRPMRFFSVFLLGGRAVVARAHLSVAQRRARYAARNPAGASALLAGAAASPCLPPFAFNGPSSKFHSVGQAGCVCISYPCWRRGLTVPKQIFQGPQPFGCRSRGLQRAPRTVPAAPCLLSCAGCPVPAAPCRTTAPAARPLCAGTCAGRASRGTVQRGDVGLLVHLLCSIILWGRSADLISPAKRDASGTK